MENDFGEYTRERVSDLPFDYNDPTYEQYKERVPQFTGQAAYIYSFEKKRMLFANGWEELLGVCSQIKMNFFAQNLREVYANLVKNFDTVFF